MISRVVVRRGFSTTSDRRAVNSLKGIPIDFSEEVAQAIAEQRPVLALESTLITHGLPRPQSISLPLSCNQILRKSGIAPATIGVIKGRIKVGLSDADIEHLSSKEFRADGGLKVGRREIAAAVVKGLDGGTTVSATMAIAHLAGIKLFSTGGIGGVHRGAETSFDISSDLRALSDTPVAVISAGCKSILDIGLTLEYLETAAVPVASYKSERWPAFYTPDSGFKAPMTFNSSEEVAKAIHLSDLMRMNSSLLLGVPIPLEYHQIGLELQAAVDVAVSELPKHITGKECTPWLLQRVSELTSGKSLKSNMALIENNVRVGGEIAIEYSKLQRESNNYVSNFQPSIPSLPSIIKSTSAPSSSPSTTVIKAEPNKASLMVIGSIAVDITMSPTASPLNTTSPGSINLSLGGVASNIAYASHLLGSNPLLIAPIGNDFLGSFARTELQERGMNADGLISIERNTAACGILLDSRGDLIGGVADMGIASTISTEVVVKKIGNQTKLVVMDGNLSSETIAGILKHCIEFQIPTLFEPTSNINSLKLLKAIESPSFDNYDTTSLSYATPNIHELASMYSHIASSDSHRYEISNWSSSLEIHYDILAQRFPKWILEGIIPQAMAILPFVETLIIKNGGKGVLVMTRLSKEERIAWEVVEKRRNVKNMLLVVAKEDASQDTALLIHHFPGLEVNETIGSATGCGDTLAATLAVILSKEKDLSPTGLTKMIDLAQRAAVLTLSSKESVGDLATLKL